jgi:FKBP-type peptidyl-prolyl cis-trans isomerase 2
MVQEASNVSIRYSLALEDGTPVSGDVLGHLFQYTPGECEIMPVLETALEGLRKGDKREILLSPTEDPGLELDVNRLAFVLGQSGRTLVLRIEVL